MTSSLNLLAPGRCQSLYILLRVKQGPVFLLNSLESHFTATSTEVEVPLLANVRGQFAEFLSKVSLERLTILWQPTCVGLRYGHL